MKVLLVEPPKDFWFIMGQYIPPPFGLLCLAAYIEERLPWAEVEVVDSQSEGLDWAGLEARMEEIKSRLPEEIGKGTDVRLDKLKGEMQSKLKELDDIKKTIVESSLEQLLAQPANLGKLIDKKLADDVHDLREKVEKMSTKSGYPDAKLAAILKESDDRIREVDKLKDRVKELEGTAVKGFEELETEIKAMTSKLGSVHGSVKGMEEAGAAGVMRDLEILKTKAEWLESTVQKFDLKPIYDKMEELETRVSASGRGGGGYAPIVIE